MFSELIQRIKQVLFYPFSRVDFPKNDESNEEKDKFFMLSVNADFDLKTRHYWHTKAAQAGHVQAMAEVGDFIIYGWIPGATLEDAYNYYTKAAEAGNKNGLRGLAECYYYGWGTEKNLEDAKKYFKLSDKRTYRKIKKMTEERFLKIDGDEILKNDREFYN